MMFALGLFIGGAVGFATAALLKTASDEDDMMVDSIGVYNEEEIHENCTVQILRNSITGAFSFGWWKNVEAEK